jgi:hypothetical protein
MKRNDRNWYFNLVTFVVAAFVVFYCYLPRNFLFLRHFIDVSFLNVCFAALFGVPLSLPALLPFLERHSININQVSSTQGVFVSY